jgi:outer membrane scaffolding protein for murein synthesis (MipA/OmpV family)
MTILASRCSVARHASPAIALAFAFSLGGVSLSAQAWGNLLLLDPQPDVAVRSVGASVWSLPEYAGASKQDNSVLPAFDYYHPSGFFASTEDGLGWNVSSDKEIQAGVRLWPQFGRGSNDDPLRRSRLGVRIQQEAFFNIQALPVLLLQSGLLHGSGQQRNGMQLELGATSGIPIGKDLLGIGLSATYANHAHRQSYYGISPEDAAAIGVAPVRTPNGWQDVSLTFSTEHRFDKRWHIDGQLIVARLVGSAVGPVVGSRQQTAFTSTLWYDF